MSYEMRHGAGLRLNSLYYLPPSRFLSLFFLSETRSLSGQEAKLVYVKRLCFFFPPLHLFPSQSVWDPIHCFHPSPKPTPLLLPILLYYASSRPPSFSSCSSALDVHTELCRIGFLLLSDLLKKSLFTSFTFHLS